MDLLESINDHISINNFPLYPKFRDVTFRLELTNICNHKCVFCPNRKYDRSLREMDKGLARRLIKEAADLRVREFAPFLNGEPFVSSNLANYISYSKECGIPYVYITTNGALATHNRIEDVMDAGVDSIKFSINAGSRDTYLKVHGRDDFDLVLRNLIYASEYRRKKGNTCKLSVSFVVTTLSVNEVGKFYNEIREYVDDIVFFSCETRGGKMQDNLALQVKMDSIPYRKMKNRINIPCSALFNEIVVSCEGFLVACCEDGFNNLIVADLNDVNIREGWYSDEMVSLRKRHINKDIKGILCHNCVMNCDERIEPLNSKLQSSALSNSGEL